jgi:hypothetical protein
MTQHFGEGGQATPGETGGSPSPSIHFLPFADGAVLFRDGTRRLSLLNAPSAFIWCSLTEGETTEAVVAGYAQLYRLDTASARRAVEAARSQFDHEGLLGDVETVEELPQSAADAIEAPRCLEEPRHWVEPQRWEVSQRFDAQGEIIEFCSDDRLIGGRFCELMAPLRAAPGAPATTRLTVLRHGPRNTGAAPRYDIVLNGLCEVADVAETATLPHLFTLLFVRTSAALRHRLLFHAAAVARGGRLVLLPGESGSGKTTLAAALAARGWQFYTDELVALDRQTGDIRPLPLPMSIKPGSLEALLPYYPQLATAVVHARADGKRVRYLRPPDAEPPAPARAGQLHALVFPRFDRDTPTRLRPLDKAAALSRLAAAGSSDRPLTYADVARMVELVERCACWELPISNLSEGIAALETEVMAEPAAPLAPPAGAA